MRSLGQRSNLSCSPRLNQQLAGWVQDTDYYSGWPYDYVTVADGLPGGIHELTVTPVPDPNPHRAVVQCEAARRAELDALAAGRSC